MTQLLGLNISGASVLLRQLWRGIVLTTSMSSNVIDNPSELVDLSRMSKPAGVSAMLLGCGYLDYATGFDLSLFALYALPIAFAVLLIGLGAGLLTALASTVIWAVSDVASGHVYDHNWMLYVNALHRLVFFLLCVYFVAKCQASYQTAPHRTAISECTQCQRVRLGRGTWGTNASYIERQAGPNRLRYQKVCPDCARKFYALAGYRDQPPVP